MIKVFLRFRESKNKASQKNYSVLRDALSPIIDTFLENFKR